MANPFAKKLAEKRATPPPSESEVTTAVRAAVAENAEADSVVDDMPMVETIEPEDTDDRITGYAKLSKLIDHDFPFDDSQLEAIEGLSHTDYGCLTGAAGTGKTTVTKAIVDRLMDGTALAAVDMEGYWKKGVQSDPDDDYEAPEKWVPAILMCAFTGRATQMIKKNFPRDWHGNIMTIHRALGFYPEYYEDWDDEAQEMRNKMRFVPTYNQDFKMPWDIVIIDEAGMLGLDLWHQLLAALKPGARIIMIGDINQLPPVHGKSIFGYAMCNWPSWELTKIHRQQGVNNPIVDNAWRIIHGQMPQSEGRFQMVELKGDASFSNRQVRKMAQVLRDRGIYDPIRDVIITPTNGEEGQRGFQLGQLPLNREFAMMFNSDSEHPRYIIDGGRERKQFAVGDKVMATKNDWEAGITNGMMGIIVDIAPNGEYGGDHRLFGPVEEVTKYLQENPEDAEYVEFSLEDLNESLEAIDRGNEKKKESRDRGPSSHIVTVRFGEGDHGIEIPFQSLAEVGSLMTAYVVTCHKMQGGEAPTILIICHDSHRAMLYREWLYTAVTRASEKCILLYKVDALRTALNKQKMPGRTLKEKVIAFNKAQNIEIDGVKIGKEVDLPESMNPHNRILDRVEDKMMTPARLTTDAERSGGLAQLLKAKKEQPKPETVKPEVRQRIIHETVIRTIHESVAKPEPIKAEVVDGGELTPEAPPEPKSKPQQRVSVLRDQFMLEHGRDPTDRELKELIVFGRVAERPALPAPPPAPVAVSLPWAGRRQLEIQDVQEASRFLLPKPEPKQEQEPKKNPRNPFAIRRN